MCSIGMYFCYFSLHNFDLFIYLCIHFFYYEYQPHQDLLNATANIGGLSANIIATLGEPDANAELQELLLQQAKAVDNATDALVLNAATKDIKMATSKLVECTKVLASHISNPLCQEQMIEAAKLVAKNLDAVSGLCLVRLRNLFYFSFPFLNEKP